MLGRHLFGAFLGLSGGFSLTRSYGIAEANSNITKENEPVKDARKEEEECSLCKYLRAGPCGDEFSVFDKVCVKRPKGSDMPDACLDHFKALMACQALHTDYYGPIQELMDSMRNEDEEQSSDSTKAA